MSADENKQESQDITKATASESSAAETGGATTSDTAADDMEGHEGPPPLGSAPLAYENAAFLNGPDGRLMRIVAEYMEPLARFRHERIQDTVVFFGSARFRGREEADHALELLDNTGSRHAAPSEEQPASVPDIAAGKAT